MQALVFIVAGQMFGSGAVNAATAASCHVEVVPADAPGGWVSAAYVLQQRLGTAPALDRDCRAVVIHAASTPASVEVTTQDGRRGVRTLADARDLEPTVSALIVTVNADSALSHAAEPPPVAPSWAALLVAGAGARLTLPGTPASTLSASAGMSHRSWEGMIYGTWSPSVIGATAASNALYTSTLELGFGFARRQPVRFGDLLLGARGGIIRLSPNVAAINVQMQMSDNADEMVPTGPWIAPTLGLFTGTAIRITNHLHLRPELSFQWVPTTSTPDGTKVPAMWNLGLVMGAESSLP
jgi:hypothetical protein